MLVVRMNVDLLNPPFHVGPHVVVLAVVVRTLPGIGRRGPGVLEVLPQLNQRDQSFAQHEEKNEEGHAHDRLVDVFLPEDALQEAKGAEESGLVEDRVGPEQQRLGLGPPRQEFFGARGVRVVVAFAGLAQRAAHVRGAPDARMCLLVLVHFVARATQETADP